jgi:5-methylcytosine-specific restriction endonuclease McrA
VNPQDSLYPDNDSFRVVVEESLGDSVKEQLQDNKGTLYTRLMHVGIQVANNPTLQHDLITVLFGCSSSSIPMSAITDAFGVGEGRELLEIVNREPIALFSRAQCQAPLEVRSRSHQLRMQRAQGIIRKAYEAGDLVEVRVLYEVLCDSCAYGLRTRFAEEFKHRRQVIKTRKQELSKMPFSKYQQTREWKVKRNRVVSLAGHRCQLCNKVGSPGGPLEVHHNNYDRYGDELLSDLVALCEECHGHYHREALQDAS